MKIKISIISVLILVSVLLFVGISYAALPKAPDVAAPAKYPTDNTVDLYTGDMSLNIPLMTVPGRGGLDFPITLGYSAGIKVHQEPSWVGLGWSLGVGGITRKVNGIPDDYVGGTDNVKFHDKRPISLIYLNKQLKVDWTNVWWGIGQAVMVAISAGGSAAASQSAFNEGTLYGRSSVAGAFGKGFLKGFSNDLGNNLWSLVPNTYYLINTEVETIPNTPQTYRMPGFITSFSNFQGSIYGETIEEFTDLNFPDSFYISSPLYIGELSYGTSPLLTENKLKLHLREGVGNINDDDYDNVDSGCQDKDTCTDAVDIHYFRDTDGLIKKFRLTNADGSRYIFEATEMVAESPNSNKPQNALNNPGSTWASFSQKTKVPRDPVAGNDNANCPTNYRDFDYTEIYLLKKFYTTWGLTGIMGTDFVDTNNNAQIDEGTDLGNWVKFNYDETFAGTDADWDSLTRYHYSFPRLGSAYNCIEHPDGTMSYSESYKKSKKLESIETPTHVAMFYTEDRMDGQDLDGNKQPLLRRIALYDKNTCQASGANKCQESVHEALLTYLFDYAYTLAQGVPDNPGPTGNDGKLTLTKVKECEKGIASNCKVAQPGQPLCSPPYPPCLQSKPWYKFEYYSENRIWDLKQFDSWGYWDDHASTLNHGIYYDVDPGDSMTWSLQKVTWPSGGTTTWYYENDRFAKVGNWNGPPSYSGDHENGGIRVWSVTNCFEQQGASSQCVSTRYLYSTNDLDFTSGGVTSSSGVANILPGTYGPKQTSLMDGSAYSAPLVGYSKVTVVPGYNITGITDITKAPYGYTVYEFTHANDNTDNGIAGAQCKSNDGNTSAPCKWDKGYYTPPILFQYRPSGVVTDYYFGFGFQQADMQRLQIPLKKPFLFIAPKGHLIRFYLKVLYDGMNNDGPDRHFYCAYDVQMPSEDYCNLDPAYNAACKTIRLDGCTYYPEIHGNDIDVYDINRDDSDDTYQHWCPGEIVYDGVSDFQSFCPNFYDLTIADGSPYGRAVFVNTQDPVAKFYTDPFGTGALGNREKARRGSGTVDAPYYYEWTSDQYYPGELPGGVGTFENAGRTFLGCPDNDNDNTCDLYEEGQSRYNLQPPYNKFYSGGESLDYLRALNWKTTVWGWDSNGIAKKVQETINEYSVKDQIDPGIDINGYNFPKIYWIGLDNIRTTTYNYYDPNNPANPVGFEKSISLSYNVMNGLPETVTENGNSETRITQTLYAAGTSTGMIQNHRWSQISKVSVYKNSITESNKVSYTQTDWDDADVFPTIGGSVDDKKLWLPHYLWSGLGSENKKVQEFADYDIYGNLLEEKTYRSDADFSVTKYRYGDNLQPCNPNYAGSGDAFAHAYITCAQQCIDVTDCNPSLTTEYYYGDKTNNKIQAGNIVEIRDVANGYSKYFGYDNFWRLSKSYDDIDNTSADPTRSYSYYYAMQDGTFSDPEGNYVETQQKHSGGQSKTRQYYDGLNRLKEAVVDDPDTSQTIRQNYIYNDVAGMLTDVTKAYYDGTSFSQPRSKMQPPASGIVYAKTEYYKEPMARVSKAYPFGESPATGIFVETQYGNDANNAWTSVKDEKGIWSASTSDKLGRAVETKAAAGTSDEVKTTLTTDILGNVLKSETTKTATEKLVTKNLYDTRSRVIESWDNDSKYAQITYNYAGNSLVTLDGNLVNDGAFENGTFCEGESGTCNWNVHWIGVSQASPNVDADIVKDANGKHGYAMKVTLTGSQQSSGGEVIHQLDTKMVKGKKYSFRFDVRADASGKNLVNFGIQERGDLCDGSWSIIDPATLNSVPTSWQGTSATFKKTVTWTSDCTSARLLLRGTQGTAIYYDNVLVSEGIDAENLGILEYEYDSLGRLTKTKRGNGSQIINTYDEDRSGYFNDGRLTTVQDKDQSGIVTNTVTYDYDSRGRIEKRAETIGGTPYTTSYTYDSADNVKTITYPNSVQIEYFYNQKGQMSRVDVLNVGGVGTVSTYTYNPTGTIQHIDFGNGIDTDYTYTNRDFLQSQDVFDPATSTRLFTRSYQYDSVGNLIDEFSDVSFGTKIGNYYYDDQHRLKKVTDFNNYYKTNINYTYDKVGNRLSKSQFGKTYNYSIDTSSNKMLDDGISSYEYDSRGNIIEEKERNVPLSFGHIQCQSAKCNLYNVFYKFLSNNEAGEKVRVKYDDGTNKYEWLTTIDTPVKNGGFELTTATTRASTGNDVPSWTFSGNYWKPVETGGEAWSCSAFNVNKTHDGKHCIKLWNNGKVEQTITVKPNTFYILSFYAARDIAGSSNCNARVLAGTTQLASLGSCSIGTNGEWKLNSLMFYSDSNSQVKVELTGTSGDYVLLDSVSVSGKSNLCAQPATEQVGESSVTTFLSDFNGDANRDYPSSQSPSAASGIDFPSGLVGSGVQVNAETDNLQYSSSNINWNEGTIQLWIKPNWPSTSQNIYKFFDLDDAANSNWMFIGRYWHNMDPPYTNGYIYFGIKNSTGQGCSGFWEVSSASSAAAKREPQVSQSWAFGTWHQIAVTWKNLPTSEIALYVDGDLIEAKTASTACALGVLPTNFRIGNNYNGGNQMNATIDMLVINNKMKSATQIKNDYYLGLGATGSLYTQLDNNGLCQNTVELSNSNLVAGTSPDYKSLAAKPLPTVISSADSTTSWATTRGTLQTNTDNKEGSYALKLTATQADAYSTYNPSGTWDFSKGSQIAFWAKSGTGTAISDGQVFIFDTSGRNMYWSFTYEADWKLITLDLSSPAGVQGGSVDLTQIDSWRFDVNTAGNSGLIDWIVRQPASGFSIAAENSYASTTYKYNEDNMLIRADTPKEYCEEYVYAAGSDSRTLKRESFGDADWKVGAVPYVADLRSLVGSAECPGPSSTQDCGATAIDVDKLGNVYILFDWKTNAATKGISLAKCNNELTSCSIKYKNAISTYYSNSYGLAVDKRNINIIYIVQDGKISKLNCAGTPCQVMKETGITTRSRLATGYDGYVYARKIDGEILKYTPNLELIKQSADDPSMTGINTNVGLDVDVYGNIYTVNEAGDQLLKTSSDFKGFTASSNSANLDLDGPAGITVDEFGGIYVVEGPTGQRMLKVSQDMSSKINEYGVKNTAACAPSNDKFKTPIDVAVHKTGVFVASRDSGCTAAGNYPRIFKFPVQTETVYIYEGVNVIYEKGLASTQQLSCNRDINEPVKCTDGDALNQCASWDDSTFYCNAQAQYEQRCQLCGGCTCPQPGTANCFICGPQGSCVRPPPPPKLVQER